MEAGEEEETTQMKASNDDGYASTAFSNQMHE